MASFHAHTIPSRPSPHLPFSRRNRLTVRQTAAAMCATMPAAAPLLRLEYDPELVPEGGREIKHLCAGPLSVGHKEAAGIAFQTAVLRQSGFLSESHFVSAHPGRREGQAAAKLACMDGGRGALAWRLPRPRAALHEACRACYHPV